MHFLLQDKYYTEKFRKITGTGLGLGLWCLTTLSTIFQLYPGGQFYWWKKLEYPVKTLNCCKSLTNLITWCYIEYTSPWAGFELTLVMIGTDCMASCKFNYHMTMTAPRKIIYNVADKSQVVHVIHSCVLYATSYGNIITGFYFLQSIR